jgi:hypothetical protein
VRRAASRLLPGILIILILIFFSSARPLASMQDIGQTALARSQSQGSPGPDQDVYALDPDHIWNRLFRLFYMRQDRIGRQYGGDELDPYLWWQTKYLLSGPSHDESLRLLDEFLQQHSERLIRDPLKRAVFQRDLLAVYAWLSAPPYEQEPDRSKLQKRIAEAIRRLALPADEIGKLPHNYDDAVRTRAFPTQYDPAAANEASLPADLFDPKGPWVCLGEQHGRPVASDHLESFYGRSIFLVFFQVPGGRSKALEYLGQLRNIPKTWGPNPDGPRLPAGFPPQLTPFPEPPQFPIGTSMAIVRQMVLIDDNGHPTATHLTESVQIRVYRAIHFDIGGTGAHSQDFAEFVLSREKLFSGQSGGLRAIAQGDREFSLFHSHGIDAFEASDDPERDEGVELQSCSSCHEAAGIHSFLSYSRERFGPTDIPPPKLIASMPSRESAVQTQWIERHGSLAVAEGAADRSR